MILAVPLCPSLSAVIVTGPPSALAVTSPVPSTSAIVVLPLLQVIVRPVRGSPLAALGVAASCSVMPMTTVAVLGLTVTDATGTGMTVIEAVPLLASLVAVIVAGPPAPLAVTSPLPSTAATVALSLIHVMTRPVSGSPFASFGVAVSCAVCPTVSVELAGLTAIDATGTGLTVTVALPVFPSLEAVIVTGPPTVFAVTSPAPSTSATAELALVQVITRPVRGTPPPSIGVASSCAV